MSACIHSQSMRKTMLWGILFAVSLQAPATHAAEESPFPETQAGLDLYLAKTFEMMDNDYYLNVSRAVYEQFSQEYPAERLKEINEKKPQTESWIHLGGGLLVNKLKDESDRFTNLIPPTKTEEFKETAYATTVDLGLDGTITPEGFVLTKVEKRADAYTQGVRPKDVVLSINKRAVSTLTREEILELFDQEEDTLTELEILFVQTGERRTITLKNMSFFVETVTLVPTELEGVVTLRISHFNRKTSEDFADYLHEMDLQAIQHMIIDLRDNTGGPPLAAREIMGFFTAPDEALFIIVKKNRSPFQLNSPVGYPHYAGDLTLLVNEITGSAAETLSGVLQNKERAVVVGQLTAGGAYLKGLFEYEDGSAILMVTSRTFFPSKQVFPNDGIRPDIEIPVTQDAHEFVLEKIRATHAKAAL